MRTENQEAQVHAQRGRPDRPHRAVTMISGTAASRTLPRKAIRLIIKASGTDRLALTIATPVTRPQAAMPRQTNDISTAPVRNGVWTKVARSACIAAMVAAPCAGPRQESCALTLRPTVTLRRLWVSLPSALYAILGGEVFDKDPCRPVGFKDVPCGTPSR